jgi:hypothetical protein
MHATCPSHLISINWIALITFVNCIHWNTHDTSISTVTTAKSGFGSRGGAETFLFSATSKSDLVPTQPPVYWVTGVLSPRVKRPGSEAEHSPKSFAEDQNAWNNSSAPVDVFMAQGHFYLLPFEVEFMRLLTVQFSQSSGIIMDLYILFNFRVIDARREGKRPETTC